MNKLCQGCGSPLEFDIKNQMMKCEFCGELWTISECDAASVEYEESATENDDSMECSIYNCSSCGAEIVINRNEASTFCIYCGNPTIVFSRIERTKRPDLIVPFKVTKEEATGKLRKYITKGKWVPRSFKKIPTDNITGIYVPYYITDISISNNMLLKSTTAHSEYADEITYFVRSAHCDFSKMTTDASKELDDNISIHLDPYRIDTAVPFNENYLAGFYSDIADINRVEAFSDAKSRAYRIFKHEALMSIRGSNRQIVSDKPRYTLNGESQYALLPVWFLTLQHRKRPYTILVNGQTGKIVGGIPFNWFKFIALFLMLTILLSFPIGLLMVLMEKIDYRIVVMILLFALFILRPIGMHRTRKFIAAVKRTSSSGLERFANKRRKDE